MRTVDMQTGKALHIDMLNSDLGPGKSSKRGLTSGYGEADMVVVVVVLRFLPPIKS